METTRIRFSRGAGRTSLHAADTGWDSYPFRRITHVVSGTGVFETEDVDAEVGPDDFLLLAPGARRIMVREPVRLKYLAFELDGDADGADVDDSMRRLHRHAHDGHVMKTAFYDACAYLTVEPSSRRAVAQVAVMLAVFAEARGDPSAASDGGDRRLHETAMRVAAHPEQRMSVPEMARAARYSTAQFTRRFKELFGMPPGQYAARARIDVARRLLTLDGLSVKETAYSLDYSSPYAFSRQFKRMTGVSPIRYAQTHRARQAAM